MSVKIGKDGTPIITIDSDEEADWMHKLPGYKDEVKVTEMALAMHNEEKKQEKKEKEKKTPGGHFLDWFTKKPE